MTDRWRRVEELFHAASARAPAERASWVADACGSDTTLRQDVESLLAHADASERFLESAAVRPEPTMVGRQIGAYRIDAFLGEGGMGEVYRAHDSRLGRDVAMKLLAHCALGPEGQLPRFEREARAASALNHPNIVTVHEIGEEGGVHFIAQELVQGETLRNRLARGPLPLDEALDLAAQVARALGAAHAAGIIHRDIKPDNVMVRPDGYVKVLDFGLAKLRGQAAASSAAAVRTQSGLIVGTVRYMSPEQARGLDVDARSDLFSLGVLLYEMVTAQPPFAGETLSDVLSALLKDEPPPPSQRVDGVPPGVDELVAKLLCKDPQERIQTAGDVERRLLRIRSDPGARRQPEAGGVRRFRRAALLLLGVGVLAALGVLAYSRRAPVLTEADTVLLTDFANTTGEDVFDGGTLKHGLAIQLRQTPFLNLVPQEAMRSTLAMMARSPDDRITRDIGLEICRRHGWKAMVTGTIARMGRHYVVTLEAIDGYSGNTIAIEQAEAEAREQVLRTLGRAARALRRRLGESLATLQKYDAPIEQATTPSLEALRAYAAGLEHMFQEDGHAAVPFFVRATELDPQFVAAYDWGAWAYLISSRPQDATAFARRGYALRARATERERMSATATYHHFVTGDFEEENRQCEIFKRLYPHDWVPYSCLAVNYLYAMGRFEDAAHEAREIIRLSPQVSQGYRFLAPALMHLGRLDEASGVIEQATRRQLGNLFTREVRYLIALLQSDSAAAERALVAIQEHDGDRAAGLWRARTLAFAGRWREARQVYARAGVSSEAVQQASLLGSCDRKAATARMTAQSATTSLPPMRPAVQTDGAVCGDVAAAQRIADDLVSHHPRSTAVRHLSQPLFRASIALARDEAEHALEALRSATPASSGARFAPAYLRGYAFLRLGRARDALSEFETILARRAWEPTSLLYPLAILGRARASAAAGELVASRQAYERLFSVWREADPDLPVLLAATREYARLRE